MRVVSLLPSTTEIVYALGRDELLAGVTFECDEPADARLTKQVVVGGRDTSSMTPGEIDAYVREQLAVGGDLYTLDEGALAAIDPDVILTQDLCRVCAVATETVDDALEHLGCRADVVSVDPHTLDEVLDSITVIGARLGADAEAREVVAGLRRRLDVVTASVAGRERPRVVVVEWVDPPFTAGHWVPDLVTAAGGVPVGATPHARSVATTWDDLAAAQPDLVVVAPCGFHLDGACAQAALVADRLPDVPLWGIDADGIVVRPGPRLVDGVEALASVLHPDAVPASTGVRRVR